MEMPRKRKLMLNIFTSFINQAVSIICGFLLPRQILLSFGSEVNGLVTSITQFLGFISIMDMGVGAVVQSSLYKPLAANDNIGISRIIRAANKFFRRLAYILAIYALVLMLAYPLFVQTEMGHADTAILVFSISFSMMGQYFFGITSQLLLAADQRSYIQMTAASITTILNTLLGIVCIKLGAGIQIVKLVSAFVLLLRPLVLYLYVCRHYKIDRNAAYDGETLTQKWDALSMHVATFVVDKTDVVVLTVFSTLANVSVYSVYHMVVSQLYNCFITLATGVQSLFGDMLAKNEREKLYRTYAQFEWIYHTLACFLFGCAAVLIIPFVQVYTKGISDTAYVLPAFSRIITFAYFSCSLRGYYNLIVKAAAHYRETQAGAIAEAVLNIVFSIVMVWRLGLAGVAIGTLIAMSFRMFYLTWYLSKHIIYRDFKLFLKHLLVDGVFFAVFFISTGWVGLKRITYDSWVLLAIEVAVMAALELVMINGIFYRDEMRGIMKTAAKGK